MRERREGRCNMCCQQDIMIRNINLYTNGSEGTELCHPCEMIVVNFIRSFAGRCLDIKREEIIKRLKVGGEL